MVVRVLSVLFILFLVVGVPFLSRSTAHDGQVRLMPRLTLYVSAAISQWALAVAGLLIFFFSSLSAHSIGFRTPPLLTALPWTVALVALSLAGISLGLFLEERGWWPPEPELVRLLIPRTPREKFWSVVLLAPTAALCEEFLYRGFLLAQLSEWLRSGVWAWTASSLAFGIAHIYQGWNGMVRAFLLGALLAYPVIHFGSLYPSMLAHGLIDALALAWLGPRFLAENSAQEMGKTE